MALLEKTLGFEAFDELRGADLAANLFDALPAVFYIAVEFFLVVPVVGECRVNLPEREIRVLELKLVRTPAIGEHVKHEFNDFCGCAFNERYASFVDGDVFVSSSLSHTGLIVSLSSLLF